MDTEHGSYSHLQWATSWPASVAPTSPVRSAYVPRASPDASMDRHDPSFFLDPWPDELRPFESNLPDGTFTATWARFDASDNGLLPSTGNFPAHAWNPDNANPSAFPNGQSTLPVHQCGANCTTCAPKNVPEPEGDAVHLTRSPTASVNISPDQPQRKTIEKQIRDFIDSGKNSFRKPVLSGLGRNPHETILAQQRVLHPTGRFPGLFPNAAAANQAICDLQNLSRMPKQDYTTPDNDSTFPVTDADMVAVVASVFDAISDWTDVVEWKRLVPRDDLGRITDELVVRRSGAPGVYHTNMEALRPTEPELANILPPLLVQQRKILGQVPSDQTVECISWAIVQAAIKSQQGNTQVPYWCDQDGV